MPSIKELSEIREKCIWTRITIDGIHGYKVTSKSTKQSIFLPASGYRYKEKLIQDGESGFYWLSKRTSRARKAIRLFLNKYDFGVDNCSRDYGFSIRPVEK